MLFVRRFVLFVLLLLLAAGRGQAAEIEQIFAGAAPESVADLKTMQKRVQRITKNAIEATVAVQVGNAHGSGVVVSKDGYVLTAGHVVGRPNLDVLFTFADGSTARGITLGRISGQDLGVIRDSGLLKITDKGDWVTAELGDSSKLRPGQWCLATGHPNGYMSGRRPVVRVGRILVANSMLIATDCTLVGGDSGGPLFDMDGKIIGIHSRIGEELNQNMHVPVNRFRRNWEQLAHPNRKRPFLGVRGGLSKIGADLAEVHEGSPAERAGLQVGDIIIEFNGVTIPSFGKLAELVRGAKPNDVVTLHVLRGGETDPAKAIELQLKIGGK